MPRWTTPALALAVATAVALLLAAPLLPVPVAAILYAAGSLICHQLPDRSFYLQAYQLPVCARCLGLYSGGAIGSLAAVLLPMLRSSRVSAVVSLRARCWLTLLAALPTIMTFTLEWGFGWRVSNATRATAAVPLGITVAFVVASALATLHYDGCTPPRPRAPDQSPHLPI